MDDKTNIEVLPPATGAVEMAPPRRYGYLVLLGNTFLASAFGAGAMFLVSEMLKKPVVNIAPLTANVKALSAENKTLKAQVTRLQRDVKAIPAPEPVDLSNIEARLERLEASEPQTIDPDLITRLEDLKSQGSEALDLSDILSRLEALENRPATVIAQPVTTTVVNQEPVLGISFPKAEIYEVLDTAEASQGWLKKSLKKHISVQSEDNPRFLVEQIEKNLDAGNISAAMAAFDKLPAEAKAAGQAWRESLESN